MKKSKKFIRHEYDLELKSMLENYSSGILKIELVGTEKKPAYFIGLIKFVLNHYCKFKGLEFEKEIQIVVTPEDYYAYKYLFGLSLIFYDSHLIRQYLNYHNKEFKEITNSKESFVGIVEFEVTRIIKYSSPFDNSNRLHAIMKWVEDKRTSSISFGNMQENNYIDHLLNWNEKQKLLLLGFSKELFNKGYTENPFEFQDVFFFGKVIEWKKNIESWIYLMHRLTLKSSEFIICQSGKKPYYSIAQDYFNFCEDKDKTAKNWNFSSMSYNIRNSKIKKHQETRLGIDSLLMESLNVPLPQLH